MIKEVDDIQAEKTAMHKAAADAVSANAAVMKTLLEATFEVLVPQPKVDEPFIVPPGILTNAKEKMPVEEWVLQLQGDKTAMKKLVKDDKV